MIYAKIKSKSGFTLIELMVVLLIIGILSTVAIPYMRGRTDAAKWAEGKSMISAISTAIRALHSEKGLDWSGYDSITTLNQLGFADGDLNGKYFSDGDFTFTITDGDPLTYTITVTVDPENPDAPRSPARMEFNQNGVFTEYDS